MSVSFESDFFVGNRTRLKKLFEGTAPIVLTANGVLQKSVDETFEFHQDRNFWYLTGIDEPDAVLVIDKSKEYIILPEDYEHRARFDGAASKQEIAETSGIKEVLDFKEGWSRLRPRIKKVKHIATIAAAPAFVKYHGFYSNPARATLIKKIKKINSHIELLDLRKHLVLMRNIKQSVELDMIRQAIDITTKSVNAVIKKTWSQDSTETDLAIELEYNFRKFGASGRAFHTIAAFDGNAAIIHHTPDNTKIGKNKSVLFDLGAEMNHYAADISRVYSISNPSKRYKQVYAAVHEALEQALSMLKPGLSYKKFEQDMEHVVGEKLRELGLIKSIERKAVRKYFPTYTSHHLGLDTHDISDIENAFQKDVVLAVEPGIYIPEEGIGIRIEENVRITDNGIELMTKALPRELSFLKIKQ